MDTPFTPLDAPLIDEQTEVKTRIAGDDHDYPHLSGYFMAYYSQLEPPISAEEFEIIAHVSCFAYRNNKTSHAGISEVAKRIASKAKDLNNRKRVVQIRLNSLQDKGYVCITERKRPDGRNFYNLIDLRPIFSQCRKLAENDGWFITEKGNEDESPFTHRMNPHSPESNKEKVKTKKDKNLLPTATADGYAAGNTEQATVQHEMQHRASEPNVNSAEKKPTPVKRDEKYKALEAVVKAVVFSGADSIGQLGGAIIQFLVISQATPEDVHKFARWYAMQNPKAALPRQCKRIKNTDTFEGKFITHWQAWRKAILPKPTPLAAAPVVPPRPTTTGNSLAILKSRKETTNEQQ